MRRRTFIQSCAAVAATFFIPIEGCRRAAVVNLDEAFLNPPDSAKAHTWWHWMNGNISEIGITRDLEAMKRVGAGGFHIFQVGSNIPKGPVEFNSPEWASLLTHATNEANRLGLQCTYHNGPGWSSSGGPWFLDRPELSMQILTWTETVVQGGQNVNVELAQPRAATVNSSSGPRTYYRDAMVIAFPAPGEPHQPSRISTNAGSVEADLLGGTGIEVRPTAPGGSAYVQLEFAEPVEARSMAIITATLAAAGGPGGGATQSGGTTLQASEDGAQFRTVASIPAAGGGRRGGGGGTASIQTPTTLNFEAARGRFFRLVVTQPTRVTEFRLSSSGKIVNWTTKANFGGGFGRGGGVASPAALPGGAAIDPNSIVDISSFMDAQGQLNWQAPAGNWVVMRIGHTTTGVGPHPVPDGAEGLECDKFSTEAYDFHFEQFFGKFLDAIAPLGAKGMAGSIIDSYEVGLQNWSPQFPQEFLKRRGYDLINYMPAMLGRVVASPEISDRFLWDVRKTQAELMNENYFGRFAADCHAHGMLSYSEPYGGGNFDHMIAGAKADRVMGEFWQRDTGSSSVKLAASVAHINGLDFVGAESFTAQSKWQEHPYNLKTLGDLMYSVGLNHFVFHRFCHQPHPDAAPGMTMGPWGWYFDRTNTWFDKSTGWLRYIARAQNMLKQGVFVGDLLYFTGEDSPQAPPRFEQLLPQPPEGYSWDTIDNESILNQVEINNGQIAVKRGGVTYQALVMRNNNKMTLPLLTKIRDLVNQGMTLIVNSRVDQSPSLAEKDEEVVQVADELWGDLDGKSVTERSFGSGRVFWGMPIAQILDRIGLKPDFEFTARQADAPVHYIHRRDGDADIYFVASRRRNIENLVCTFRVDGKQPEFWNAETGEIAKVAAFESVDGRTRVPIRLEQAGSMFVVFRAPAPTRRLVSMSKDSTELVATQAFPAPARGLYREVTDNFTISLWVKSDFDGPIPTIGLPPPVTVGGANLTAVTYVFYPPAGEAVYGSNHAACGLVATCNGVAVYERSVDPPAAEVSGFGASAPTLTLVASAAMPLPGWTHVTIVYRNGAPSLYINGKPQGVARASGKIVHPGLGEAYDAPIDFTGQNTEPQLFNEALSASRIQEIYNVGLPAPLDPPAFEPAGAEAAGLLYWQNGNYSFRDSSGSTTSLAISGIGQAMDIAGPWTITFPPNLGAPDSITLPQLTSLHRHSEAGVKYFSGVATYTNKFTVPDAALADGKRLYLDLGRVEVVADVLINGQPAGNVWKPPYRLDITSLVRAGENDLEVQVANLWPNRLIGDEEYPAEYDYGGGTGEFTNGIRSLPDWYVKGQPKPSSPRIAFTTWKWYSKGDPLFESGLLGPVRLRSAIQRSIGI